MKVTFIYPDIILHRPDWTGYFYAGIASLSGVLKNEGHHTSLIHITQPIDKFDFIKRVKRENPDLIGFSATSHMFPFVKKFASWLVETKVGVLTICGGIHPTIAPNEAIRVNGIDIICRGEGEAPLVELCRCIKNKEDISGISNLWIKKHNEIIQNPLRPLMDDINMLPFPDRSIFDYPALYGEREGRGNFLVARGCPYKCTYCCNPLLRKIYESQDKSIRFRSVDKVIAEIKDVLDHYPFIKTLNFDDDILFLNKKWAEEFAEKHSRQIALPFSCNTRANLTDRNTVNLLKKAGCYHIKFGVESGNEYILNKVLNRNMTNAHIKKAFRLCKQAGLITESFNMVGIPYEKPSCILDTVKLNASIAVDKMHVAIYQPYQGTKLGDLCKKKGFIASEDLKSDLYSQSVLELNTISPSQILMLRNYFKLLVRYYQLLQKLPHKMSMISIGMSDRILSNKFTAIALNIVYIPINYIFRRIQFLIIKAKITKAKDQTICVLQANKGK